ncbi:MAG TPA: hypothetical protein VEH84_11485 [Alphaproteobacteria bacterium]|nr:hypothetical protein [Alphaproteobacteria bacterium]
MVGVLCAAWGRWGRRLALAAVPALGLLAPPAGAAGLAEAVAAYARNDLAAAAGLAAKDARAGRPEALTLMGLIAQAEPGRGAAAESFRKAAEKGEPEALYRLGALRFEAAMAGRDDIDAALTGLSLAAQSRHEPAIALLLAHGLAAAGRGGQGAVEDLAVLVGLFLTEAFMASAEPNSALVAPHVEWAVRRTDFERDAALRHQRIAQLTAAASDPKPSALLLLGRLWLLPKPEAEGWRQALPWIAGAAALGAWDDALLVDAADALGPEAVETALEEAERQAEAAAGRPGTLLHALAAACPAGLARKDCLGRAFADDAVCGMPRLPGLEAAKWRLTERYRACRAAQMAQAARRKPSG